MINIGTNTTRFLILTAAFCLMAEWSHAATFGKFTYYDNGSSITITGYPTTATGAVVIPTTIAGKSVTAIGDDAFYECASLTSVTIPNSVNSIGYRAFLRCTLLTSVTIPNSVTYIERYAFFYCSSLTSITIPGSVTYIGGGAFSACAALKSISVPTSNPNYCSSNGILFDKSRTMLVVYPAARSGSYTIPSSVSLIEEAAFEGCNLLTSLILPSSVSSIGSAAFADCSSLTSVTIPDNVVSIGSYAFSGCTSLASAVIGSGAHFLCDSWFTDCISLKSISVSTANPNCSSRNGVLFNKSQTVLMQYPGGRSGSYKIPSSVTTFHYAAFEGCSSLTSVNIPNSVNSIENAAFEGCSSLSSVTIPNSVTSIGNQAFLNCTSLTSVLIGSSVTTIGSYAFYGCSSLTTVTIPNSVSSIVERAFLYCTSLTSVTIGNSVTSIGDLAFDGCAKLAKATFLGKAPTLGLNVFDYASPQFTVVFIKGSTGFTTPTWNGYPAVALPKVPEIVVQSPLGSDLSDGASKKTFGSVMVGSTSVAKTFTVLNTGTSDLTGITVAIDGKNAGNFIVSPPAKTTLAPGEKTSFKVTFKPTATGTRTAAIHVASNDLDENSFDIMIAGMGTN